MRHTGWDIGALAVARENSRQLGARPVAPRYSRLLIACYRPPASEALIPLRSEATEIRGNRLLDRAAREARIDAVYAPCHAAIEALLDARATAGRSTIFVAIHSFTPAYLGKPRPWQIGVLYGSDWRLTTVLLAADRALIVGDNERYRADGKDYGTPSTRSSLGFRTFRSMSARIWLSRWTVRKPRTGASRNCSSPPMPSSLPTGNKDIEVQVQISLAFPAELYNLRVLRV